MLLKDEKQDCFALKEPAQTATGLLTGIEVKTETSRLVADQGTATSSFLRIEGKQRAATTTLERGSEVLPEGSLMSVVVKRKLILALVISMMRAA